MLPADSAHFVTFPMYRVDVVASNVSRQPVMSAFEEEFPDPIGRLRARAPANLRIALERLASHI